MEDKRTNLFLIFLPVLTLSVGTILLVVSFFYLAMSVSEYYQEVERKEVETEVAYLPEVPKRKLSVTQIIYTVAREEGLSEAVADRFVDIATCESGLNPRAVSSTNDHGLLQIHAPLWTNFFEVTTEQLYDPELNVQLAVKIYKRSGFQAWACNKLV